MKKIILVTIFFTAITLFGYSQKVKDTTITLTDTLTITIHDINETLEYLSDKLSHKEWNAAQQFYIILYNKTLQRKKKKP